VPLIIATATLLTLFSLASEPQRKKLCKKEMAFSLKPLGSRFFKSGAKQQMGVCE
jgi:hypothetical protein